MPPRSERKPRERRREDSGSEDDRSAPAPRQPERSPPEHERQRASKQRSARSDPPEEPEAPAKPRSGRKKASAERAPSPSPPPETQEVDDVPEPQPIARKTRTRGLKKREERAEEIAPSPATPVSADDAVPVSADDAVPDEADAEAKVAPALTRTSSSIRDKLLAPANFARNALMKPVEAVNTAALAVRDAGIKTAQKVSEISTKTVKAIDVLEVFSTPEERAENAIRRIDDQFGHAKEEKRAEEERDANHQKVFNLPVTEKLTTEYSCAIQKKVLLHGKLFVFKTYLGFRSTVFGDTTETMALRDVAAVEKKNTAFVVPNAIEITMVDGTKHFLTSFLFRDEAFKLIETLWLVARGVGNAEAEGSGSEEEDNEDEEADATGTAESGRGRGATLPRAGSGVRGAASQVGPSSTSGKTLAGLFGRLRLGGKG